MSPRRVRSDMKLYTPSVTTTRKDVVSVMRVPMLKALRLTPTV
jgi:hypothetical protein